MLSINKKKCTGCGACREVCPEYVFDVDRNSSKGHMLVRYPDLCNLCGHCMAVCLTQAITDERMPLLEFEKISEPSITTRTMKQLLLLRHSVRAYKDKEVPEGVVKDLIEVATHAGTGSNLQCLDFVVIKNKDILGQLEKLTLETIWHTGLKFFDEKSLFADIMSKKIGMELSAKYRNYHKQIKIRTENRDKNGMIFRGAPMVIVAHDLKENSMGSINAGIALRNIEITAQTMGLGCCWAGFFINAAQKRPGVFNKILGINSKRKVYGALMIGFPKYKVKYKIPRVSREVKFI